MYLSRNNITTNINARINATTNKYKINKMITRSLCGICPFLPLGSYSKNKIHLSVLHIKSNINFNQYKKEN